MPSWIKTSNDNWKYRRRIIHYTLVFCALMIGYLVLFAPSDSLRENLAIALTGLSATVVTGYVFGAVLDDKFNNRGKDEDQ